MCNPERFEYCFERECKVDTQYLLWIAEKTKKHKRSADQSQYKPLVMDVQLPRINYANIKYYSGIDNDISMGSTLNDDCPGGWCGCEW